MKLTWHPPVIDLRARHHSDAEHSAVVAYGGYRADNTVMPARNFIEDGISSTNFAIKGSLRQGFIQLNEELHVNIKNSIVSKKWEWDRPTYRRNGDVVGSPRDIVDNGELLNSQSWELV